MPVHNDYRKALEQTFAPEFINRIDDIVVFDTLDAEAIETIAELEFGRLCQRAASLGYHIEISDQALRYLAKQGYQPKYGVRSLKRQITEHIEEPLAQMIVAGDISEGDTIGIEYQANELRLLVKAA
jgi:ATP-dependent Clp protease ATP-binding subunit ClpC